MPERFLKMREVAAMTGFGKSTLYRRIEAGTFPPGRDAGNGCVRWLESEVAAWMKDRPIIGEAGKADSPAAAA